jgi:hypothetical protein
MKTNAILLLASLAVLTSAASAASNQTNVTVLVLPTYVVTAPRDPSPEQQIKARLHEFRQQALAPITIVPDLNLLNGRIDPTGRRIHASRTRAGMGAVKS